MAKNKSTSKRAKAKDEPSKPPKPRRSKAPGEEGVNDAKSVTNDDMDSMGEKKSAIPSEQFVTEADGLMDEATEAINRLYEIALDGENDESRMAQRNLALLTRKFMVKMRSDSLPRWLVQVRNAGARNKSGKTHFEDHYQRLTCGTGKRHDRTRFLWLATHVNEFVSWAYEVSFDVIDWELANKDRIVNAHLIRRIAERIEDQHLRECLSAFLASLCSIVSLSPRLYLLDCLNETLCKAIDVRSGDPQFRWSGVTMERQASLSQIGAGSDPLRRALLQYLSAEWPRFSAINKGNLRHGNMLKGAQRLNAGSYLPNFNKMLDSLFRSWLLVGTNAWSARSQSELEMIADIHCE